MQKFTSNLVFLIPFLGFIAGLSLAFTIPLFMVSSLYLIKDKMKITFNGCRLEFVFFLLVLLSCMWSIKPLISLSSVLKVFTLSAITYVLIINSEQLLQKIPFQSQKFIITIICITILFSIEFMTHGAISLWFRTTFQGKEGQQFYLYYLDRGCTLFVMFAWVVIAQLLHTKKTILAFIVFVMASITLGVSDSLSGFLGISVAGVVFILTKYTFFRNPKILSLILVVTSVTFVLMSLKLNPYQLSEDYKSLPASAKHRLFIWDYVAEQATSKPIFGWGHRVSRQFDVPESAYAPYEHYIFHPLPTHPHNNVLQILLENGLVGLALYLLLACKYLFKWHNLFDRNNLKHSSDIQASGNACFATFFIISMISYDMWQTWWMCSFLWVGILFSMLSKLPAK